MSREGVLAATLLAAVLVPFLVWLLARRHHHPQRIQPEGTSGPPYRDDATHHLWTDKTTVGEHTLPESQSFSPNPPIVPRLPAPSPAVRTQSPVTSWTHQLPARPTARRAVRLGPTRVRPARQTTPDCWLPDGVRTDVAGLAIAGGMIYVGATLPADTGHGTDPALINPSLPVDHRRPDLRGASLDHWPCYSAITPAARAFAGWSTAGRTRTATSDTSFFTSMGWNVAYSSTVGRRRPLRRNASRCSPRFAGWTSRRKPTQKLSVDSLRWCQ